MLAIHHCPYTAREHGAHADASQRTGVSDQQQLDDLVILANVAATAHRMLHTPIDVVDCELSKSIFLIAKFFQKFKILITYVAPARRRKLSKKGMYRGGQAAR